MEPPDERGIVVIVVPRFEGFGERGRFDSWMSRHLAILGGGTVHSGTEHAEQEPRGERRAENHEIGLQPAGSPRPVLLMPSPFGLGKRGVLLARRRGMVNPGPPFVGRALLHFGLCTISRRAVLPRETRDSRQHLPESLPGLREAARRPRWLGIRIGRPTLPVLRSKPPQEFPNSKRCVSRAPLFSPPLPKCAERAAGGEPGGVPKNCQKHYVPAKRTRSFNRTGFPGTNPKKSKDIFLHIRVAR